MLLKKENRFVDVHTSGIPLCHPQLTSSQLQAGVISSNMRRMACTVRSHRPKKKHLCNGYLLAIKHGTGWKISYHVLSGFMIFSRVHMFFPFKCPFLGHVAMFEDTGGSVHKNHTLMVELWRHISPYHAMSHRGSLLGDHAIIPVNGDFSIRVNVGKTVP